MEIRPFKFENYIVIVEKNAMSAISDKVCVCVEGVNVLQHGHYLT